MSDPWMPGNPLGYLIHSGCYSGRHLNTYHRDLFHRMVPSSQNTPFECSPSTSDRRAADKLCIAEEQHEDSVHALPYGQALAESSRCILHDFLEQDTHIPEQLQGSWQRLMEHLPEPAFLLPLSPGLCQAQLEQSVFGTTCFLETLKGEVSLQGLFIQGPLWQMHMKRSNKQIPIYTFLNPALEGKWGGPNPPCWFVCLTLWNLTRGTQRWDDLNTQSSVASHED